MPKKETVDRAREDREEGRAPSTQAGEFVREEMEKLEASDPDIKSRKQAIAIGLSKARRAGVKLPAPKKGTAPPGTRRKAKQDLAKGAAKTSAKRKSPTRGVSPKRSRATTQALKRESPAPASSRALSRQARAAATRRKKRGATTRGTARRTHPDM